MSKLYRIEDVDHVLEGGGKRRPFGDRRQTV